MSANDPKRTCVGARRTKFVASCAPAARQWSASYPRSFAMITVSPAAASATSNTMIKGAPRTTPIRPTKTPIKRHSTICVGAPKIIDFLHQKNLCDWLRLGFSFEPWQRQNRGTLMNRCQPVITNRAWCQKCRQRARPHRSSRWCRRSRSRHRVEVMHEMEWSFAKRDVAVASPQIRSQDQSRRCPPLQSCRLCSNRLPPLERWLGARNRTPILPTL